MPTASGQPSFDDLVAFFNTTPPPSPMDLSRRYGTIVAGMIDLRDRLEALESGHLTNMHRASLLEDREKTSEDRLNAIDATKAEVTSRLDTVEKQPALDKARVDDLETRVRTLEGAVGHANLPDDGKTPPKPAAADATDKTFAQKVGLTA
jgi:chromosome segregation ATPase